MFVAKHECAIDFISKLPEVKKSHRIVKTYVDQIKFGLENMPILFIMEAVSFAKCDGSSPLMPKFSLYFRINIMKYAPGK